MPHPSSFVPAAAGQDLPFTLPDRTGSSSSSSPAYRSGIGTDTQQSGSSSHTSPSMLGGLGNTAEENRIDLRQFQGRVSAPPQWDMSEPFFFGDVSDEMLTEALGQAGSGEPWSFLTADIQWPGSGGPTG